ncbi:MAG: hypothetical protein AAF628_19525 [Planctomycetota bacterium]
MTTTGGTITINETSTPSSADIYGPSVRGSTVTFSLDALPGSLAVLLLAYDPTLVPLEPFIPGSPLGAFVTTLGPWTVPGTGNLLVPQGIPQTWPLGHVSSGMSDHPIPESLAA